METYTYNQLLELVLKSKLEIKELKLENSKLNDKLYYYNKKLILMWIVRDKDGTLWFASKYIPVRTKKDTWTAKDSHGKTNVQYMTKLDEKAFQQVTWKSDPLEVFVLTEEQVKTIKNKEYSLGYSAGIADYYSMDNLGPGETYE